MKMTRLHMLFGLFLGCGYAAEPHRPVFFLGRCRCCLVVLSSCLFQLMAKPNQPNSQNDGAAIPLPIFFLFKTYEFLSPKIVHCANIPTLETSSKKIGGGENKTNTTFLADFSLQNCFRKHGC